jgi:hypothetical protein
MEREDFFGEVAKQLESEAWWSQLDLLEESGEVLREEPSWASGHNLSGSGEFLKRKPSKLPERMTENVLYSTQIIHKSSLVPQKVACLDLQLSRLERTLNYHKNSSINPHFKRQKTLLKRLAT